MPLPEHNIDANISNKSSGEGTAHPLPNPRHTPDSPPDKSEPPHYQVSEKPYVYTYDAKKALEGRGEARSVRKELAEEEFKTRPYSDKMKHIIEELKEELPDLNHDGRITPAEISRAEKLEPWRVKQELQEKLKGGLTRQERWDIARGEKERGSALPRLWKKMFGKK